MAGTGGFSRKIASFFVAGQIRSLQLWITSDGYEWWSRGTVQVQGRSVERLGRQSISETSSAVSQSGLEAV